jgi:hypothetical protein
MQPMPQHEVSHGESGVMSQVHALLVVQLTFFFLLVIRLRAGSDQLSEFS